MRFDPFSSPDRDAKIDSILGGWVRPPDRSKVPLTPSTPATETVGISHLQNEMRHGWFFDATDVTTWSNGSHLAYQYPPDFDIYETSLTLSLDPYVRKKQLESFFLIKIPVKDENSGTITSELRLFPKKDIKTRYLGLPDMFAGITNTLPVAYQVMRDITRFPPDNPQMIQNYFAHIREIALSLRGVGHDESIRNIYGYLTKEINYTWLRENYFQKMRHGFWVVERYGPKTVGKLVHSVRSRLHGISSSTSHHSQSGLASAYDRDGVGRGIAGTMLYMLSFLGINDVHVVEGIAPDPGLAHLRPASGWSETELTQLEHAWVRIDLHQYDPTRDIGKSPKEYVWFKKTEAEALKLGHEWYGKIPWFTREKLVINFRKLLPLLKVGLPIGILLLLLNYSSDLSEDKISSVPAGIPSPPSLPSSTPYLAPPIVESVEEKPTPQTRYYSAEEIFHSFANDCYAVLEGVNFKSRLGKSSRNDDIYGRPTDAWNWVNGNCATEIELPIDHEKARLLLSDVIIKHQPETSEYNSTPYCFHRRGDNSTERIYAPQRMKSTDFQKVWLDPRDSFLDDRFRKSR